MPIRDDFPTAGSPSYLGGHCDGWEYILYFSGSTLQKTYEMIQQFLQEEGYANVPIPTDAEALKYFKQPKRNTQLQLFSENGYIHNPIKILFPARAPMRHSLALHLYNEQAPQHLLRFHRVLPE